MIKTERDSMGPHIITIRMIPPRGIKSLSDQNNKKPPSKLKSKKKTFSRYKSERDSNGTLYRITIGFSSHGGKKFQGSNLAKKTACKLKSKKLFLGGRYKTERDSNGTP